MKNDRRMKGIELAAGVIVVSMLSAGCASTGSAPAKKPVPAPKTAAAKPAKPAQPAKAKLAMPKVDKPVVQPVSIAAFDWQNSSAAPRSRAEVLAAIEKKSQQDEFDAMVRVTDMDGKQLAGFLAAVDDRMARLAAWEKSEKGKRRAELKDKEIPAAQEGKDESKLKALATECAQLDAEYGALRVAVRVMVMGVMTLQQQQVWAAQKVMGAVSRSLGGAVLDADQQKKLLAICVETAATLVKEDTVAKDPYLGELLKGQDEVVAKAVAKAKTEVLTKDQQAKLVPKQ